MKPNLSLPKARAAAMPRAAVRMVLATLSTLTTLTAMTAAPSAWAQSGFPERPITLVVPFGPGGTTDIMARILADEFARQLGGAVVVLNTAGAGGAIGMGNVARARADGYTLSMTTVGPLVIQPARRDNTGYTPDGFDYICGTYDVPLMTLVAAQSPHKDYAALVAHAKAKANSGAMNYGSSGIGTLLHISGLLQWQHHGVQAVHVPYKSTGDMVVPLKNGEIAVFNETPPVAVQYQLRPLMSLTDQRVPGFENVPSARELGVPVRGSVWGGVVAPRGLPAEVRDKLELACRKATATTLYKARAQAANSPLVWRDGEAFRRFALAEAVKLKQVVIANGLVER